MRTALVALALLTTSPVLAASPAPLEPAVSGSIFLYDEEQRGPYFAETDTILRAYRKTGWVCVGPHEYRTSDQFYLACQDPKEKDPNRINHIAYFFERMDDIRFKLQAVKLNDKHIEDLKVTKAQYVEKMRPLIEAQAAADKKQNLNQTPAAAPRTPLSKPTPISTLRGKVRYEGRGEGQLTALVEEMPEGYHYIKINTFIKNRCNGEFEDNTAGGDPITAAPMVLDFDGPTAGSAGPVCKIKVKFSPDGNTLTIEEDSDSGCAEYRGRECAFTGTLTRVGKQSQTSPVIPLRMPYAKARKALMESGWKPAPSTRSCGYTERCRLPEAEACIPTGISRCDMVWAKGGETLVIEIPGEGPAFVISSKRR